MKKINFFAVFLGVWFLFIGTVNAEVQTETLKEACETEKLTCDFEEPKNTSDLPNIYVFRGNGCSYCKKLLQFLIDNAEDFQKKVNIVVYEVAEEEHSKNWDLYLQVGAKFGDEITGYPYLVIGKQVFNGYASTYDDEIIKAIDKLTQADEKYDVVKEIEAGNFDLVEKEEEKMSRGYVLAFIFGVIIALGAFTGYKELKK